MSTPREIIEQLIDGMTSKKWDQLPELFAEDVVIIHPLSTGPEARIKGRHKVAEHFARAAAFDADLRICVFAMAKKLPVFGSFTSGSLFATSAESLVSFAQRPQLSEIPEAACRAAPAVPTEGPSRCSPRSLDVSPSAEKKRSATVGPFPTTARLSPSLTSAISSSTVGS
jgi:hypothetical protein